MIKTTKDSYNTRFEFDTSGKIGVLLINLGTPDQCNLRAIRSYLKEFLSDPRVIDIPFPLRWLLLHAVILPFRSKKTMAAYQQIWQATGSPLRINSQLLTGALSLKLGDSYHVSIGMRYGNPSIASALDSLKQCQRLIILPLFPQYSSAATGSAIARTCVLLAKQWNIPQIHIIHNFYNHPDFIKAYATVIKKSLTDQPPMDLLLFSYHGLPQRHIYKSHCKTTCGLKNACTEQDTIENPYCYRAQCYATSRELAKALDLNKNQYAVSFQSRLGRTPWIKPYTDEFLATLIQDHKYHIAVVCPSFVADCLETLEEIGIRAKNQWQSLGGKSFIIIPCLNATAIWIEALESIIKQTTNPTIRGG